MFLTLKKNVLLIGIHKYKGISELCRVIRDLIVIVMITFFVHNYAWVNVNGVNWSDPSIY